VEGDAKALGRRGEGETDLVEDLRFKDLDGDRPRVEVEARVEAEAREVEA
jgi:hypothetical protein